MRYGRVILAVILALTMFTPVYAAWRKAEIPSAGTDSTKYLKSDGANGWTLATPAGGVTSLTGGGGVTVSGSTGAVTLGTSGLAASGANTDITNLGNASAGQFIRRNAGGTALEGAAVVTGLTGGGGVTVSGSTGDVTLSTSGLAAAGRNSDITAIWGLTKPLPVGSGGTGSNISLSGVTAMQAVATKGHFNTLTNATGVVTVPDDAALRITGDLTIEAWIAPGALGYQRTIVTKGALDFSGVQECPYSFLQAGTGDLYFGCTSGSGIFLTGTSDILTPNRWHHVAVTVTSGTVQMYVDGQTSGAPVALTVTPAAGIGKDVYIGREPVMSPFIGGISQVRIWNVARSQANIQTDMWTTPNPATAGLVACYNFTEGSGATLGDSTAGAHNGTITDMTWGTSAMQLQLVPYIATNTAAGSLDSSSTITTVSGSTSGNLHWTMPVNGSSYKKCIIVLDAFNDAGTTITFSSAFTHTPALTSNNTALSISTLNTTQIVIPAAAGVSGVLTVEGI